MFVHLYLYMDFSNIPGIMISIHSLLFLSSSQKIIFHKKENRKNRDFFMTCKVFLGSVHVLTLSQGSFTFCIVYGIFFHLNASLFLAQKPVMEMTKLLAIYTAIFIYLKAILHERSKNNPTVYSSFAITRIKRPLCFMTESINETNLISQRIGLGIWETF